MLQEVSVIDSINIRDTGHVEIRRADRILRDGEVVAETYHRHVLTPGDDLAREDPLVAKIAASVWEDL